MIKRRTLRRCACAGSTFRLRLWRLPNASHCLPCCSTGWQRRQFVHLADCAQNSICVHAKMLAQCACLQSNIIVLVHEHDGWYCVHEAPGRRLQRHDRRSALYCGAACFHSVNTRDIAKQLSCDNRANSCQHTCKASRSHCSLRRSAGQSSGSRFRRSRNV